MSKGNKESNMVQQLPQKGDKVEVVKILILAIVSFVLGFGLVIFFLSPDDDTTGGDAVAAPMADEETAEASPKEMEAAAQEESKEGYAPAAAADNPLMEGLKEGAADAPVGKAAASEADAPVEVPPGRTPDGISLDGDGFYLKCWNNEGQETPGSGCDPLKVLEKRFATRLYVVDKCKQAHAGAAATGKLSIGMEINFDDNTLSFWNGASSTLENAGKVCTCLRNELRGLPIHSVSHKFSRYRLFFTVLFGKSTQANSSNKTTAKDEKKAPSASAAKLSKGKMVEVVMDRVRVRKSPVDGEVIGKISSGNQVKLLGKKGDWCQVLTPNENEGWMICEALK